MSGDSNRKAIEALDYICDNSTLDVKEFWPQIGEIREALTSALEPVPSRSDERDVDCDHQFMIFHDMQTGEASEPICRFCSARRPATPAKVPEAVEKALKFYGPGGVLTPNEHVKALMDYTHHGLLKGVPEGYVLVPIEPTKKIIEAMHDEYLKQNECISKQVFWEHGIYKAMIANAAKTGNEGDEK